jgi:hypothetical protein
MNIIMHVEQEVKVKQYCTFYTTSAMKTETQKQRNHAQRFQLDPIPPVVISQNPGTSHINAGQQMHASNNSPF